MKERALYHLLLLYAKSLSEKHPEALLHTLDPLVESLTVDRGKGVYRITSRFQGEDILLEVPNSNFAFYQRGDTNRPGPADSRQQNWRMAGQVWQQLFQACQADPLNLVEELAPVPRAYQQLRESGIAIGRWRRYRWWMLATTILSGALGYYADGSALRAAEYALISGFLLLLGWQLRHTHLHRAPNGVEILLIGLSAVLPALAGIQPSVLVLLLPGLLISCWAEARGNAAGCWPWAVAGAAATMPLAMGVEIFWLLPMLQFAGVALIWLMVPNRIRGAAPAYFLLGALAVGGLTVWFMPPLHLTLTGREGMPLLGAGLAGLFLVAFLLWWMHGLMYRLTAWWALLLLSFYSLTAFLRPELEGGAVAALGGLGAFLIIRLARGFLNSW